MEPFIVSARKYRPKTFKDVVGQEAITNTLTNAINNNHLAQALLFCGPRGVGKTTCARILAKKINEDGSERDDEDFAFNIFELDAASNNSVDDIRSLIDQVRIPPQVGKYKVYIIDEVHMLSQSAFNAFLKTLEEPPKHAIFILATTEKHKIIPTILSRCQIFDFKRITVKDAANYLKYIAEQQGIQAEDDALHIIAQKADGAMRDALSIFDRVVSFSGKELTRKAVTENLNVLDYETFFEATALILQNDIPNLLLLLDKTLSLGFDGHHFISGLASHFRDLMVCQNSQTIALLEVGEEAKARYGEQAQKTSKEFLLKALDIANDCDLKYKTSRNQRLLVELTLMKLASISFDGEKKKSDGLIPASYFQNVVSSKEKTAKVIEERLDAHSLNTEKIPAEEIPPVNNTVEVSENESYTEESVTTSTLKTGETKVETATDDSLENNVLESITNQDTVTKPKLKNIPKRVSGLSLSSLKTKKDHENNKDHTVSDETALPRDDFDERVMQEHWSDFAKSLIDKGRRLLASNLQTDTPKLKDDFVIAIELPNHTMKKELERAQKPLLDYLKEKLNNHFLSLEIHVNEEVAKRYAFTPEEKYEKLKEKNPALELLRKEFDLDL